MVTRTVGDRRGIGLSGRHLQFPIFDLRFSIVGDCGEPVFDTVRVGRRNDYPARQACGLNMGFMRRRGGVRLCHRGCVQHFATAGRLPSALKLRRTCRRVFASLRQATWRASWRVNVERGADRKGKQKAKGKRQKYNAKIKRVGLQKNAANAPIPQSKGGQAVEKSAG